MSSNKPELQTQINNLNRLGHRIRRLKTGFLSFDPPTQIAASTESLNSLVGTEEASRFMDMQMAGQTDWVSPDDTDLPESARLMLNERFDKRIETMWIAQAYNPNSAARLALRAKGQDRDFDADAGDFIAKYQQVAGKLDLFPNEPNLAAVPLQRQVPVSVRTLAARIMFFNDFQQSRDLIQTGQTFVNMLAAAQSSYMRHSQSELQETVMQKSGLGAKEFQASLMPRVWESPEDLAMICVDRGLRDLVMDYYPVFRSVQTESDSGYNQGQHLMSMRVVIGSCKRVNL